MGGEGGATVSEARMPYMAASRCFLAVREPSSTRVLRCLTGFFALRRVASHRHRPHPPPSPSCLGLLLGAVV